MLFVHNAIHSCMEISNNKLSLLKGFSGYLRKHWLHGILSRIQKSQCV